MEIEPQRLYGVGYQTPYLDPGMNCYSNVNGASRYSGYTSGRLGSAISYKAYPQTKDQGICSGETEAMQEVTRYFNLHESPQPQPTRKSSIVSIALGIVTPPRMEDNDMYQISRSSCPCLNDASGMPRVPYAPQMPPVANRAIPASENWPNSGRTPQVLTPAYEQIAIPYQVLPFLGKAPHIDGPKNTASYMHSHELIDDCVSTLAHPTLAAHLGQEPNVGWRIKDGVHGLYLDSMGTKPKVPLSLMKDAAIASCDHTMEVPGLEESRPTHPCATPHNADVGTNNEQRSPDSPRVSRREKIGPKATSGRKKRTLSPNGRDHAKKIRRLPGGACDICKRKKTKCTHRLSEDQIQLRSPTTPFTDIPTPEEESPMVFPDVLSSSRDTNHSFGDLDNV